MKGHDTKHPGRNKWHNMQTKDAWYSFKRHTVHLTDDNMRSRILTLIKATNDPFATEIRYHRACWRNYVTKLDDNIDEDCLHLENVRLSEVKEMCFQHARTVIFEQHELRSLQGLLSDYKNMLKNFGFECSGTKSSTIKDMLQNEFKDKIDFHGRLHKNESTLVYDLSAEAAIYSWGVSDDQLINTVARRL